jgi:AraC family transcriptional regulator of adaptative response / DNA-3-methyladenine glycosylase II
MRGPYPVGLDVAIPPACRPDKTTVEQVFEDVERCRRAVGARDARFDGWFFTAVVTTGIYCRPSCPVAPPKAENMRFFPSAAAAQQSGFRACKRCRPDATPGSPEWDVRADITARAMRLIADGVVDREGVPGLARRVGYQRRQLERHLRAELGAGPLALARAQRAQTARLLIETTALPMTEVAFAAGFGSVRQFNDTVREVFALSPVELRGAAGGRGKGSGGPTTPAATGTVVVRLPYRVPLHPDNLFGHLVATGIPGVEEWRHGAYRRTLRLPHGPGIVALSPGADFIRCALALHDLRDLATAIARCRRLFDLDADPLAVDDALRADPALAPLVDAVPGRRVPRTVDGEEFAVRAVLGQQISTAAARKHAARMVLAVDDGIADPTGGLTHLWPTAAALRELDPATFSLPGARKRTLTGLFAALDDGGLGGGGLELGAGVDRSEARAALVALPGIGPWTVETVAMRALGDPDAFPVTDLGIKVVAAGLGLPTTPAALLEAARRWQPWRSYAVQHLWATGDHAVNRMPTTEPPATEPPTTEPGDRQ